MSTFNITIVEAIDASSFNIKNNDTAITTDIVLTIASVTNAQSGTYTITGTDLTAFNSINGLNIGSIIGINNPYPDDMYDFTLSTTGYDTLSLSMGFYQVIGDSTMKESLNYRYYQDKYLRDIINEKIRLLRNLRYSTDTGNPQAFQQNLLQLQNIR